MRLKVAGGLLALLTLAGCAGDGGGRDEGAIADSLRYGGTVVTAYLAEPSTMNHFASVDENAHELQRSVLFTALARYDESLTPEPFLAERWEVEDSQSGSAITFYLRNDVRWHDGEPTTARDVKFTFDRIKDPATGYPDQSLLAPYDSATVVDDYTITFYFQRHPGYLDPWAVVVPMPEHILGNVPPAELAFHPFGTETPIGNGPFRFVEHRQGDRWIFEANPDFPEALGGRPYIDRLVYRVIEDQTTRLTEFLAGEVDVYFSVAPQQVAAIEEDPDRRTLVFPSRSYAFINWNGRLPLFSDARVRRAMTLGINREQIIQIARNGFGETAKGSVPPFHWAFDRDLPQLTYNPDAARSLLDSAGWIDSDGDGVRERDGIRASFELRTNPNPTREDIMALVQADLAQIGIEVRTDVQEAQSLAEDITSPERRFDAFVLGWTAEFRLDDRNLFACSRIDGPFQWASYCNPRVDELLDRVMLLEDRSQALPLWHEYQEIIQRDQPYTFIYYDVRPNGIRQRVRNVEMDIRGNFINVQEWWIAPSDRS